MDTATATPRQKIKKRETTAPELLSLRDTLSLALEAAEQGENTALQRAIEAGRVVVEVKEYLRQNPLHLLDFKSFWARYFKGKNRRTANTYERVYRQVKVDSSVNYPSISECLAAYRKANPPKKRFTPDAKEAARKKLLAGVDDKKDEQPPEDRTPFAPKEEWLGEPEPEPETEPETEPEYIPLEEWFENATGRWEGTLNYTSEIRIQRIETREFMVWLDGKKGAKLYLHPRGPETELESLVQGLYHRCRLKFPKVGPIASRTAPAAAPSTRPRRSRQAP